MTGSPAVGSSALIVIVPAIVTLAGTVATLVVASRARRREESAATIKLGVTTLVDQLQEERAHLASEVEHCRGECDALRHEVLQLRGEVDRQDTVIDDLQAQIIGLKRKAGEL